MSASPGTLLIGKRYETTFILGKGGNGAVYLATDLLQGNRAVALKILRKDRVDPTRERALVREYATLCRLHHPHVEAVLDFGRDDDHGVYIAKEYLAGPDILRASASLSLDRKLGLLAQLFHALAFLHRRGLVHNDIKPDNVLILTDPTCPGGLRSVLIDFGIAAPLPESAIEDLPPPIVKTKDGRKMVSGTLGYMAPERLRGETPTIASDLYAAGILIFRLLAGRFPFPITQDSRAIMKFHLMEEPPHLSSAAGGLPSDLDRLVMKLLAKDPATRPADATEAASQIEKIASLPGSFEIRASREGYIQSVRIRGRDLELARLDDIATRAMKGERKSLEPAFVLIEGKQGVGKSRLLSEAAIKARLAGRTVLTGRGRRSGTPLEPFLPTLKGIATAGEQEVALAILTDTETRLALGRTRMLEAIGRLIIERAEELFIIVDDLHFADDLTLDLLLYLARRTRAMRRVRLCCLMAVTDEPPQAVASFVEKLRHEKLTPIINLEALDEKAAAEIVREALGSKTPPETVNRLIAAAEGEPLAILELLKLWASSDADKNAPIPSGIERIYEARLRSLRDEPRQLLSFLAFLRRPAPLDLLATAANLDPKRCESLLADLRRRDFVVATARNRRLYYETLDERLDRAVGKAVEAPLEPELHERLAGGIQAHRRQADADEADEWLLDLAHHLLAAGIAAREPDHIFAAGSAMEEQFAWDRARDLYQQLLELPDLRPDAAVQAGLGLARVAAGEGLADEAAERLDAAILAARYLAEPKATARLLRKAAEACRQHGNEHTADRLEREAADLSRR